MTTAQLKLDLINRISDIKKVGIIRNLKTNIEFEMDEGIYRLSKKQKDRIAEGRVELKNGNTLSEEIANNDIFEWLSEK